MTEVTFQPPKTMRTFLTVWGGQVVSTLGSSLTSFAIGLWLYIEGGSVTAFALVNVFYLVPWALLSPVAGAYVDRHSRKKIMLIADTVQAFASLLIGAFVFTDLLQVWHVYLAVALSSAAGAFQGPAWSASIALIVPKDQLGRASGMGRVGEAIGRLASPAIAGVLMLSVGLGWIVLIDVASFIVALITLGISHIPNPPHKEEPGEADEKRSIWQDVRYGLRYLWERPGLFGLVMIGSLRNLFQNFATTLLVPMVLVFANEAQVGTLSSIGSSGMLIGSLIMSAWGGPKAKRVYWLMGALILQGLAIVAMGLQPSLLLITVAAWLMAFTFAFLATLTGPIWQTKVALDVQGRVFSTITFLAVILEPMGQIIVGPLTDKWLEPAMRGSSTLANLFGPLVGLGEGRGMAVVFLVMGLAVAGLGLYGYLNPRIRNLETELPDVIPDDEPEIEAMAAGADALSAD